MKTCLLPMDSRPCTYDFPQRIAAIAGTDLTVPPLSLMDHFLRPSRYGETAAWLLRASEECDTLIVSVDQLLYGGLIASRQKDTDEETALSRLGVLREIRKRRPELRIYGFNVLMRTTVSVLSLESRQWWAKVAEYSRLEGRVKNRVSEEAEAAARLREEIPAGVLEEFLAARRRNHLVNLAALDLAAEGIFDLLLILQEDCAGEGFHRVEQEALREKIRRNSLDGRVWLHNGTDEAAMELLARKSGDPLAVEVRFLEGSGDFTALYEDRPFKENLESHFALLNFVPAEKDSPRRAGSPVLFIYPPRGEQLDHCSEESPGDSAYKTEELEAFAQEIVRSAGEGKRPFLLDLAYANGGDLRLMKALAAPMPPSASLAGYAAWNTTSNSLGTILSQIAASSPGGNTPENRRFTGERILDDLLYQAVVRRTLEKRLRDAGGDPWNIKDISLAQNILDEEFALVWPLSESLLGTAALSARARFRWPRTFEAELSLGGTNG